MYTFRTCDESQRLQHIRALNTDACQEKAVGDRIAVRQLTQGGDTKWQ